MKISKRLKVYLLYIIAAIILLFAGSFAYVNRDEQQYPRYSSYNTRDKGVKALYYLSERTGFTARQYDLPARFLDEDITLFMIEPEEEIFNKVSERDSLAAWIKRGNTLIFVASQDNFEKCRINEFDNAAPLQQTAYGMDVLVYRPGKGHIIYVNQPERFTNNRLKEYTPGYVLVEILKSTGNQKVFFDEYVHGIQRSGPGLREIVSPVVFLLLLQAALAALAFMLMKAKRFGSPETVLEVTRRPENENIYALSNLYIRSKANGVVF